jgi:hypothetical protein
MSHQHDSSPCRVPAFGIVTAVFLIFLLAAAGCSSPDGSSPQQAVVSGRQAASSQQQASSSEPVVGPVPVAISAAPSTYTPAMSSAPGIALTPQVIRVPGDGKVRYHWKTDLGYFLSWEAPLYQVQDLGQETANAGGVIYWTWQVGESPVSGAQKAHITLEVTDAGSGALLANGGVDILIQDGVKAQVQPR